MGGQEKRLTERLKRSVQKPYVRRVSGQAGGSRGVWSELGLARAGWTNGRGGWRLAVSCRKGTFPPSPSPVRCGGHTKIFLTICPDGVFDWR
jgi:hypothetical protein